LPEDADDWLKTFVASADSDVLSSTPQAILAEIRPVLVFDETTDRIRLHFVRGCSPMYTGCAAGAFNWDTYSLDGGLM